MHLLAAGDSLTYGFDVPMPSRWLTKLVAALPDLQVTNLGMCGAGLDQVLQRAERTLREPTISYKTQKTSSRWISDRSSEKSLPSRLLMPPCPSSSAFRRRSQKRRSTPAGKARPPFLTRSPRFKNTVTRSCANFRRRRSIFAVFSPPTNTMTGSIRIFTATPKWRSTRKLILPLPTRKARWPGVRILPN